MTSSSYSYREVGGTRGPLPAGYRIVRRDALVGHGRPTFEAVAQRVLSWQVHRDAGLLVDPEVPHVHPDAEVRLGLRAGPLRIWAPCRVVYVIEEERRQGFAYGTRRGHPERGESLFEVSMAATDEVRFRVVTFSSPATWWSRAGAPVTRWVQDRVTDRYVHAATAATSERSGGGTSQVDGHGDGDTPR